MSLERSRSSPAWKKGMPWPRVDEAHGQDLPARARGDAVAEAGLQLHRVEEVLVVVNGAVVDGFDRRLGVAGGLAVVVDLRLR